MLLILLIISNYYTINFSEYNYMKTILYLCFLDGTFKKSGLPKPSVLTNCWCTNYRASAVGEQKPN